MSHDHSNIKRVPHLGLLIEFAILDSEHSGATREAWLLLNRPSKCPKFYTTMISGETNLRQKERKFCQN